MHKHKRETENVESQHKICFVEISLWEKIKFYVFSIFWGAVALVKLVFLWSWHSKKIFQSKRRGKPPRCLVDSSLGQHSYIKLKGAKLHYVESGCSDHPLLILLHGFLDCWIGWRHQITALAPHFRVVAVDLKGFGDSEKPQWRSKYHVAELVQELAEFIAILGGGEQCVVIGHDLGAMLGWFLLYSHPELVARFVSVSCAHPNMHWQHVPHSAIFNPRFVQECQLPGVTEMLMMREDLAVLDQYLSHLPAHSKHLVSRETYKFVFSRKLDWTCALNYYRGMWASRLAPGLQAQVPVLLLVGELDNSCSLQAALRSTETEERLSVRVVSGAGHFPHQQAPGAVNKLLLTFLAIPEGRVGCVSSLPQEESKGLVNRMFGALSSTVTYGNQVLGSVTKRSPLDMGPYRNPGMYTPLS